VADLDRAVVAHRAVQAAAAAAADLPAAPVAVRVANDATTTIPDAVIVRAALAVRTLLSGMRP